MRRRLPAILLVIIPLILLSALGGFFPAQEILPDGSSFSVHFIDVGQGDAALVMCDGKALLIDGGSNDKASLIYSYLRDMGIQTLEAVVCTHAHADHAGGLAAALSCAQAKAAYSPYTDFDGSAFNNFLKKLEEQGLELTVPEPGLSLELGSAKLRFLGPLRDSEEENNMSLVLRIEYGSTSFLFTGDAEYAEERDIVESGQALESTLLKVAHHGSEYSSSYVFLREVMPKYAVISVGRENEYGHPSEAALSRLRDLDAVVYRTDECGSIICESDGTTLRFTCTRDPHPAAAPEGTSCDYIINIRSRKFHLPDCSGAASMSPSNRLEYTGSAAELIADGFSPCGSCKPNG